MELSGNNFSTPSPGVREYFDLKFEELKHLILSRHQDITNLKGRVDAIEKRLERLDQVTNPPNFFDGHQHTAAEHELDIAGDLFPIVDTMTINEIEMALAAPNNTDCRSQIIRELRKQTANNPGLKAIISDSVLIHYNFNGKQGKKPLESLHLLKVYYDVVFKRSTCWDEFVTKCKNEIRKSHHRVAEQKSRGKRMSRS